MTRGSGSWWSAFPRGCAAAIAGTGVVYGALAWLMWNISSEWGSAFWPGAGVTLAALVRMPRRAWPAVLLVVGTVEFLMSRNYGMTIETALWGSAANTVEPFIGALVFRRMSSDSRLSDLRSVEWLLLGGALAGPAVGALFGGLLAVGGPTPAPERWIRWFVGDGVGVLAVSPLLLVPRTRADLVALGRRWVELAVMAAAIAGVIVLLVRPTGDWSSVSPYLAVPVMVWAALRFGVFGAAASSSVIALTVHAATATGHGAFVVGGSSELVVAQTFIGVTTLSMLALAVLVEDLDRRRRREQELLFRAMHDQLTGLANRAGLEAHLEHAPYSALLVIDLDGFKAVNDGFGHATGDRVLRGVADRLVEACRAEDLVARIGGDEFVVVVAEQLEGDALVSLTERLRTTLSVPFAVDASTCRVGASIGVVVADGTSRVDELLMTADRRMYLDKASRAGLETGPSDSGASTLDLRPVASDDPAGLKTPVGWEDAGTS